MYIPSVLYQLIRYLFYLTHDYNGDSKLEESMEDSDAD